MQSYMIAKAIAIHILIDLVVAIVEQGTHIAVFHLGIARAKHIITKQQLWIVKE